MLLEPETPLYAVGTSLGANILVKYLGEDGVNVPLVGAVAISNPWDLLIGDRFFTRAVMQRFYDRVLGNSLKGAAKLHKETYVHLSDWEGIEKVGGGKDQYTNEDMDHIREEWAGYVTNLIFR